MLDSDGQVGYSCCVPFPSSQQGRSMIQTNYKNALQSRCTVLCAEFCYFDLSLALMGGLPGLYARIPAPGEYKFSLFEY